MPKRVNKGPTGGEYDNDTNVISDSGETQANEATNATGRAMSYNAHTSDSQHEGSSSPADTTGGQAASSRVSSETDPEARPVNVKGGNETAPTS